LLTFAVTRTRTTIAESRQGNWKVVHKWGHSIQKHEKGR